MLAGIVEDRVATTGHTALDAERPLEHGPRRLAGPESGHAGPPREVAHGLVHGLDDLVGGKLNVEDDLAAVGRRGSDLHGDCEVYPQAPQAEAGARGYAGPSR